MSTSSLVTPIPDIQSAIVEDDHGRLVLSTDRPVPKLRPGTVLVKTTAVALNPSDYKIGAAFPSRGAIVGMDFSGHIAAIHSTSFWKTCSLGLALHYALDNNTCSCRDMSADKRVIRRGGDEYIDALTLKEG